MICQIHNTEYTTRCQTCRSVAARRAYYVRRGIPVPEEIGGYWRPGSACSVCGEPVLTEQDKHPRTCTHRKCGDPHSDVWRTGDPCTKCQLPVTNAAKHKRFKAHAKCIEAQIEETKRKKRIVRTTYNKKRWASAKPEKSKRMVPMFIGTELKQPQAAPVVIVGDVQVRYLPSLMKATLRDPISGTYWSEV